MTVEAGPVRADPCVTGLVTQAQKGDKQAWDALVDCYAPLIWSICRRHRLGRADADIVGQRVWRQLAGELVTGRDPAEIPGWLAATAVRECGRVRCAARRPPAAGQVPDGEDLPAAQTAIAEQELRLAERHAALRAAFARLPPLGQELIPLLIAQPPVPHDQISAKMGIPADSIGPCRDRCLQLLRHDPAIAALIDPDTDSAAGQMQGQPVPQR